MDLLAYKCADAVGGTPEQFGAILKKGYRTMRYNGQNLQNDVRVKKYLLFHKYGVTEKRRPGCVMHVVTLDCME
jgi:hypothetical protein